MTKDNKSYWSMSFIGELYKLNDLNKIKELAEQKINNSNANLENKTKGLNILQKNLHKDELFKAMANFNLSAHGLKVL